MLSLAAIILPLIAGAPDSGTETLALASQAVLLESWVDAADLAQQALSEIKPNTEKHESALFVLATALEKLGYSQAAAEYYLSTIERRQNPALLSRALERIEHLARSGLIADDRLFAGVVVEIDLATIPTELAGFLGYYRGLSNLRLGHRRWAIRDFGSIDAKSHYGPLARYVAAVTAVHDGKPEKALKKVAAILENDGLDEDLRRRLVVMQARLQLKLGDTEGAIKLYRSVPSTSITPTGELLMERAWAHFDVGQSNDAMGLIYALGSPSNRDLFLPEQYILQGLIYQRFCHFRAAKGAVRNFRERYGGTVAALERGEDPSTLSVIVQAAEQTFEARDEVAVRAAVATEKGRIGEHGFGDGLTKRLTDLYALLETRSGRAYREVVGDASRWVAERLLETHEQANLLKYEVGVSIFKRIDARSGPLKRRARAPTVPLGGEQLYFPFDGEFWSDELEDMRFLIEERCVD